MSEFVNLQSEERISYDHLLVNSTVQKEKGMQECDVQSGSLTTYTRATGSDALWEMVFTTLIWFDTSIDCL